MKLYTSTLLQISSDYVEIVRNNRQFTLTKERNHFPIYHNIDLATDNCYV